MGRAIDALHNLYRKNDEDQDKMIEAYVQLHKKDNKDFHFHVRRKVSVFYQEMAFFVDEDPELQDIVFRVWTRGDLEIIKKIILPLELFALPQVVNDPSPNVAERIVIDDGRIIINSNWAPAQRVMANLYNDAVAYEEKHPN